MQRWLRPLALLAALAQFIAMLIYSINLFSHFDLGIDFGILNQATSQIASGHLNPYNTLYQHPFWSDQFNLLAWPLALVRVVFPSSLSLLVVQDLAIATTSFLVIDFAIRVTARAFAGRTAGQLVVGSVILLALSNPYAWQAASFDVHMQTIAALGLVLAVIGFWEGRALLPWVGLAIALMSGTESALLVAGLGAGMVVITRMRRNGIAVAILGIAWLALVIALNAHQGTPLNASYGYLAHSSNQSLAGIVLGMITHPATPITTLTARGAWIARIFVYSGLLGSLFPPALGASVVAIGANALQYTPSFITLQTGFQNYPETLLLVAGFPIVAGWIGAALARRSPRLGRVTPPLAAALALAIGAGALLYDASIPPGWLIIPPRAAAVLDRVHLGPATQVFAAPQVVGRFSNRKNVLPWIFIPEAIPVCSSKIEIVVEAGYGHTFPSGPDVMPFVRGLAHLPQARLVAEGANVYVYEVTGLKRNQVLMEPSATIVKSGPNGPGCAP